MQPISINRSSAQVLPHGGANGAIVTCTNVDKHFLVMDRGDAWRLLFSREPKGSRSFQALNDISLTVPKGEFVGLLGRNGAGKSTLLRTVGGVFTPTGGFVSIAGHVAGLYGLGIGGHELITGREFTRRWLDLNLEPTRDIPAMIEEVREFTELAEYFDRPLRTYSTGMRARLFFATVTAIRAAVYVIDEILVVGDEYFSAKCWRRLRERLANGASGLFATHDWSGMLKVCSQAYVLDHGRVVDSGSAVDVARRYIEIAELEPGIAEFGADLPEAVRLKFAEPGHISLPVTVHKSRNVAFAMSIEAFKPFYGWQHLLHVSPTPLADKPGRYRAEVSIPDLPLAPGQYTLNVFVVDAQGNAVGEHATFDARSWLYGNALGLTIEGDNNAAMASLDLDWTCNAIA